MLCIVHVGNVALETPLMYTTKVEPLRTSATWCQVSDVRTREEEYVTPLTRWYTVILPG